jgi:hypothetical protein
MKFSLNLYFFLFFFKYVMDPHIRRSVRPKRTRERGALSMCPCDHPNCLKWTLSGSGWLSVTEPAGEDSFGSLGTTGGDGSRDVSTTHLASASSICAL